LDAHATSCTFGVISEKGKRLKHQVVETSARSLIDFVKTVRRPRYLCLEEGTQSAWLYEVLRPRVDEIVVTRIDESKGPKDDVLDAFQLAEKMRIGTVRPVFKHRGPFSKLISLSAVYGKLNTDKTRAQNRLKALYRSRGVSTAGTSVYGTSGREQWLKKLPAPYRFGAELIYAELDAVVEIKKQAEKSLIEELRRHRISRILRTCPGMGDIRTAQLMAAIVSPHRFRTKRQLWKYSGLSVVMRSSADWALTPNGWERAQLRKTRGLNRDCNRTLKDVFKGAATTVIRSHQRPLYDDYLRMLEQGTKPPLARLTLARKIAATLLAMWKNQEAYNPDIDRDKP
jgi:transposase